METLKENNVPLKTPRDVSWASEQASVLAEQLGFDRLACAELALAVSEICQNALVHGGGGEAIFHVLNGDKIIQIIITDEGKGIPNIERALEEGFSTKHASLGIGLDVTRRSVDRMELTSAVGKGTKIILEKHLPIPESQLKLGVVSVPDSRYDYNGDKFFIKEFEGNKLLIGVIDGVGQGYKAHLFSVTIKEFLLANYELPLIKLLTECHETVRAHNVEFGAAVGLALFDFENRVLELCGIGDTHAHLNNHQFQSFNFDGGQIGLSEIPRIKSKKIILPQECQFVFCTDGIRESIDNQQLSWGKSAQWIANNVFNLFHRPYGDATVVTAKINL